MSYETQPLEAFLASLETGKRPLGGSVESGVPSLGGEHINADGSLKFSPMKYVPEEFFAGLTRGFIHLDDILIVKDGATTGRVGFVDASFPFERSAVNEHVFIVRTDKDKAEPLYLYYFLRSKVGNAQVMSDFRGAAQGGISRGFASMVHIPVRPLPEQRRIVDILSRAEGIVRLRRDAEKKAAELIPALFLDMFGDPATNPMGWPTLPIAELCNVQTGGTPSRDNTAYYEGEIPWVKTGEVAGGVIQKTEEHISEQALAETNCKRFPVGTILVAMYGQGQTRGRCAMLGIEASTNQACAAILPSDLIAGEFLFRLLQTQYEHLRSLAQGGNQANLNLSMIKNYSVILPPIKLQEEFVDRVITINSIQSQQSAATAKARATFDALLAQVFQS